MATTVRIKEDVDQPVGRGVYLRGARDAFFKWQAAGKEPSRERALEIIAQEHGTGIAEALGEDLARNNADGSLNSRLSFWIWDLTENGRGAIDYDVNGAFVDAMLQQAANILSGTFAYAANAVKCGGKWISMPETRKVPGAGVQGATTISRETREEWAATLIYSAKYQIARARGLKGIDWPFIRRVLVRLIKEARAEWMAKNSRRESEAAD
jgi:hypothetical protein